MISVGSSLRVTVMFAIVFTEKQLLVTEKKCYSSDDMDDAQLFLTAIKFTGD